MHSAGDGIVAGRRCFRKASVQALGRLIPVSQPGMRKAKPEVVFTDEGAVLQRVRQIAVLEQEIDDLLPAAQEMQRLGLADDES